MSKVTLVQNPRGIGRHYLLISTEWIQYCSNLENLYENPKLPGTIYITLTRN